MKQTENIFVCFVCVHNNGSVSKTAWGMEQEFRFSCVAAPLFSMRCTNVNGGIENKQTKMPLLSAKNAGRTLCVKDKYD